MNIQMKEETHTVRLRTRGPEVPCPLLVPQPPAPRMFTNLKAVWTLYFGGFMGASLPRHKWWNHWPLVIESTSSLSPCPGKQRLGLKSPTLYSQSVPLTIGAHPWGVFQKSLCNIAKNCFLKVFWFIWLCRVFVVAFGHSGSSLLWHMGSLFSCDIWVLILWPGINPGPPALGAWSVSHWTTREVPTRDIFVDLVT